MDQSVSINKFISDSGYCSRREADKLIEAGRVLLNNEVAQTGNRYYPGDVVEVDGSILKAPDKEQSVYIALNKPVGITTTSESHVPGNIVAFVNHPKRIFPIGRLDKDSEGLILLTNDGDIVNKILRAGNRHEKEYIVRIHKPAEAGFVAQMSKGVPILGTTTAPCKIQMIGRQTFRIILTQGLNRQIRRMCQYFGYKVLSLKRIRIMDIHLGKLPSGKWRNLSEAEVKQLKASLTHSGKTEKSIPPPNQPEKTKAEKGTPRPAQTGENTATKHTPGKAKNSYKAYRNKRKRS